MAVTDNASLFEDHEAAPTYTSIGGGQGASQNSDFFLVGASSSARRCDNVTYPFGWWHTDGTTHDLSTAGMHFLTWIQTITPAEFTNFGIRLGSDTSNYEEHSVGVAFYPDSGGWIPLWVEVNAGTDTGSPTFTAIDFCAIICAMGDIGSNLQNLQEEQNKYSTRPVLLWDGSGGDLDDFITSELTNFSGTLLLRDGVYFCFSNLQIGSATATTFTHNNATISWPDATWLPSASVWMGIDVDLQNASTDIDLSSCVFQSANPTGASARKPDFLVTGTSGVLDISRSSFIGMRVIDLNSQVTADGASFSNCGVIDAAAAGSNGASMLGASVLSSAVATDASALVWNVNADPDGELDDMTFSKGANAHHALELGTSSPLTVTLRGWTTSGFNASNEQNDSTIYVARTSGTVTINVVGGTGNFSYKSAGATVNVVIDPVTTTITVKDPDGTTNIENARVLVEAGDGTGDLPFEESVSITRSGSTATVTHTGHGLETNDKVVIRGADQQEYNGIYQITVTGTNTYTYTVSGTPATPATGTITSTGVIVEGLTNASGQVSATRAFSVDQNVRGRVRESTGAPYYVPIDFLDTVDNVNGLLKTVQFQYDE